MRISRPQLRSLITFLAFSGSVVSAQEWTITTSDFESRVVTVRSMNATTLTGRSVNGKEVVLPTKSLIQISRDARTEPAKGLILCVAGGDRLIGQPRRIDGANLAWAVKDVGEISVPMEQALGVMQGTPVEAELTKPRGSDEILLANGDQVKGIVTAVTDKSVNITPTDAVAIDVPLDSIRQLLFAAPPQGRAATKPAEYTVRLTNGGVISCTTIDWQEKNVKVTASGGTATELPTSAISSIEYSGGPVVWLSTCPPTQILYTPYFHGDFQPRMDRTVTGEPIRFGKLLYQRGIGVHSKTRITWTVQPGDLQFRTRYAIDPQLGYADVDVRVYVDDKIFHEAKGFKAGVLSPVITADLAGAKTLTLEVDYGKGYDVQDRLDWIEPAIIRGE